MTDSHTPTHNRGVTQRLTTAQQHWSGRAVVIWTCTVNWRGLIHSSKLPVWAVIQHDKYELNLIHSFCLFLPPNPPFLSFFAEWTEPANYLFVTHIVCILSSAEPTVNVYVVVYCKLYLHICFYGFSLYRILILYIVDKCEIYRTRALFVRSHQVWAVLPRCDWSVQGLQFVTGWAVGGSGAETKHVRNDKGHILGRRSCKSFLDLGRNVRRPISTVIRGIALHAVSPPCSYFLGIKEPAPVLPLLLPLSIQGLPRQAHSFIFFYVPFCKSFSWITALIVFFSLFDCIFDFISATFISSTSSFPFFSNLQSASSSWEALAFFFLVLFCFRDLIMPYRDSMLGK